MTEIDLHPACDIVLATGSLVEGFGNAGSDLDLFVVNWTDLPLSREKKVVGATGRRWADVEYLDRPTVVELHARVMNEGPRNGWHEGPGLTLGELDTYHRLATGVLLNRPLCDLADWPLFDRNALGRKLAIGNYALARSRWLDAVGALMSEQYGQAWYAGREAMERGIDAYLSLLGETNPSQKWLGAKLARVESDPCQFRDLFWAVCCPLRRDAEAAHYLLEALDGVLFQVSAGLACGRFRDRRSPLQATSRMEVQPDGRVAELHADSSARIVDDEEAELA